MLSDFDSTPLYAHLPAAPRARHPSLMKFQHVGARRLNKHSVFAIGLRSAFVKSSYRMLILTLVALALSGRPVVGQRLQERPFWPEIQAFLKQDRAQGLEPCRTLFVGSSSIRLWMSLESDLPARNIIRRGFGGAHLTHVVRYFDLLIERHRPSQIVLYAGENDIASGRSPANVLTDLKSLLKLKTQSLGAAPVYFIAIKPSLYHWEKFARQTHANALIKRLAETRDDLVFVDIVPLMLKNGKPKRIYMADGLHMNRDGYALWAKALNGALDRSGVPTASHCRQ